MMTKYFYLLILTLTTFGYQCSKPEQLIDPIPDPPLQEEGAGKTNLALGGIATASSYDEGREPSYLIDGKIEQNQNQGYFSSTGTNENHTEWVKIELKELSEINEIWIYPRYDGTHEGFPVDFVLETSANGEDWKEVASAVDFPKIKDALPRKFGFSVVSAKFIRLKATSLYSTNNEWTDFKDTFILQLGEIEIYKREQSVLAVKLDTYFSTSGVQSELKVSVETERTKENTEVVAELLRFEDNGTLSSPIKQTGKIVDNKADLMLQLPASLPEGEYKVEVQVKGEEKISKGYSNKYVLVSPEDKIYYISASEGDDHNDGLSEQTPFKTLTKISSLELKPGTKILLKASDVWQNQNLYPTGSGTKEKPIVISSYGSGAKPIISPGFENIYGIRIVNGSGYEIRGLEITNCYAGIVFWFENSYNHKYILIEDCYVHFITGTTTGWGGGWDQQMPADLVMPTGICINGSDAFGNSRICEDMTIRNTKLDRCDVGIQVISRDHDFSGKWDAHGKNKITPNNFHNLKIANCEVTRSFRTGGICLSCVDGVDARNISIDETGYQGVGMYWGVAAFQVARVSNALIENCTFSNTIKGSSPDGQGFDFEADNTNVTVRKCRFINNDGSGLLCYGDSWPGVNSNNVVDQCYFEGNNRVDDHRIFNIGKPANSGIVKNSVIHLANKATDFYAYPLVFDESNKVYDATGNLIYNGGPSRSNPLFYDQFDTSDLTKWQHAENATVQEGKLALPDNKTIYTKIGQEWENYFVETKLSCQSDTATPGIVFRADESGTNCYVAKVKLMKNFRSVIEVYKINNGQEENNPLVSYPCYSMQKDITYTLRIDLKGNTISIYMDGNLMGTLNDLSFASGLVGLSNSASGTVFFDEVLVNKL